VIKEQHYRRKVAGSRPDEVYDIYEFTKSFRPHWALEFTQPRREMDTRSRRIMILGSKMLLAHKAVNNTTACELIV
jgi:hypothetical protein